MFQGSMVAIATPMKTGVAADTPLDAVALRRLLDFHLQSGTDAIVAVGTTGESATLDEQEHIDVIRQVVEHVNKRVPVIAGTGANSTTEAITLTRAAKEAGWEEVPVPKRRKAVVPPNAFDRARLPDPSGVMQPLTERAGVSPPLPGQPVP